jgi:hypothetical protein
MSPIEGYATWSEARPVGYFEWRIPTTSADLVSGVFINMVATGVPTDSVISGLYIEVDQTGDPVLSGAAAIYGARICMRELGLSGNTECGLCVENYATTANVAGSFIFLRNQGSGVIDSAIRIMGSNKPDYLFKLQTAVDGGMLEAGNITSGKSVINGLRCKYGAVVGVIPLYED